MKISKVLAEAMLIQKPVMDAFKQPCALWLFDGPEVPIDEPAGNPLGCCMFPQGMHKSPQQGHGGAIITTTVGPYEFEVYREGTPTYARLMLWLDIGLIGGVFPRIQMQVSTEELRLSTPVIDPTTSLKLDAFSMTVMNND